MSRSHKENRNGRTLIICKVIFFKHRPRCCCAVCWLVCWIGFTMAALCLCSRETMAPKLPSIVNFVLFRPPRPTGLYCFPSEVARLETRTGSNICATWIEKEGATIWILLSHANAEDLNTCYRSMLKLSILLDVNVICYDYSGYGLSTGENGLERD